MLLDAFKKLLKDYNGFEMYVTGPAGTGKTTSLAVLVEYCIANKIPYVVCAYTHKACGILASKLPKNSNIQTLHAFLTKRPTINEHAKAVEHIETSTKQGTSEEYQVMFLDEYSMIGERDYADIGLLQDPTTDEPEAHPNLRVVYIGDSNQLPPVGDQAAIFPSGKYQVRLTKVYRQAGDNKLLDTLGNIVKIIEGKELGEGIPEHDTFQRGRDLVKVYKTTNTHDKVILAYTNERVEELNAEIKGRYEPMDADYLYSPTLRGHYSFTTFVWNPWDIQKAYGTDTIERGSKYKTLEHLIAMDCCNFMECISEETDVEELVYAVVFGHYQYKLAIQHYATAATEANRAVEDHSGSNAKAWCIVNKHHPLARARRKAWRNYLTFKECVVCMDFPYAMTVHKSQGSTYDTVLVDTNDLYKCAARDYGLYLKLMYVAISRASNKVYTS